MSEETFQFDLTGEGHVTKHEFIHMICRQPAFERHWGQYQPARLFDHAERAERGMEKNEDLTILLTDYNPDEDIWLDNMSRIPDPYVTRNELRAKIREAARFLEWLGM